MSMRDTLPHTPSPTAAGVYVVPDAAGAAGAALRDAGWRVAVVHGAGTKAAFLRAVGEAGGFPDHYGANLDALWDCLGDVDEPFALVWSGWEGLAVGDPDGWAGVMDVFRDRTREGSVFAVVLCPAA